MAEDLLTATRVSLHAVAEQVLAGPQYRVHATIRLRITPGGFGQVKGSLRVQGADLVGNDQRLPLTGSIADLGAAAGIAVGAPQGLYDEHAEFGPDDGLIVDPAAANLLASWFECGDQALREFMPEGEPVLWPEHFDLGISADAVNYGISPGDARHALPYAYVGPWTRQVGDFWNTDFGAIRSAEDVPDTATLIAFFSAGRAAARGPVA